MKIAIPELSLVTLIGASGSGKSTFARNHFLPTEILSSDFCRGLVADDENEQSATTDAFEVLHFVAAKRLAAGRLTVVDATNVQPEARKPLVALARQFHVLPVAIVLNLPGRLCQDRNKQRPDRAFSPHVVRNQVQSLKKSLRRLKHEGFRHVFVLNNSEEVDAATVERVQLWNNRKEEHGPFDIVGDIHGCFDELRDLLGRLGYGVEDAGGEYGVTPPEGRKAVFLGDLVDRGPKTRQVLQLVMRMVSEGNAICVPGNHDMKLVKKLRGRDVQITHGLAETLQQLEGETTEGKQAIADFLDGLVSHYVLDGGKLVVAHAGMREEMQGRGSGKVRDFALYGETTGEIDAFGLKVRADWAAEYRGKPMVVYGHTPIPEPEWLNRTINIDTGCVFGGRLTALRYPEKELVSVPAKSLYYEPVRPFEGKEPGPAESALTAQQVQDDLLDLEDVTGKRIVNTRFRQSITVREENAIAALEVMTRFAANPKWLIYLPPTMSPSETSGKNGYLEHPDEAFAYYRHEGVAEVVCEQKHMGSRAVVVVCRDEDAAARRFGVTGEGIGACYTRTGRPFFPDSELEASVLGRVAQALTKTNFWERHDTDWVCLDCELMPWSAKAQELLRTQYAATGSAACSALPQAINALETFAKTNAEAAAPLVERYRLRAKRAEKYVRSYRQYCWTVTSVGDYKLAPFHVLATGSGVHFEKSHVWHMTELATICDADSELLLKTPYRVVNLTDGSGLQDAVSWWEELTTSGGEGMVVKPSGFIEKGRRGLVQPALKCRGREYLRIIYGPEYTAEESLAKLRRRSLGTKRSLALREFSLGIESLERFIRQEPLRRVHECVFGVLALESEPVDPRL